MAKKEKWDISSAQFVTDPPPTTHHRKSKYTPLYEMFDDLWDRSEFEMWVRLEIDDKKEGLNLRNRLMDYSTKYRKPVETAIREEDGQTYFYFRPKRR